MSKIINKLKNRHGVVLEVAAISGLALTTILIVLGLNTYFAKAASQELRFKADLICMNIASSSTFAAVDFAKMFSGQIDIAFISKDGKKYGESIGKYSELKEAKLTLPTMPYLQGARFNLLTMADTSLAGYYAGANSPAAFSEFSSGGPNSWCYGSGDLGANCKLVHSIPSQSEYPDGTWSQAQNAGNQFGCELIASVDQFFGSPIQIVARTVAWRSPLGDFGHPIDDEGPLGINPNTRPGLILAVAPHMTTNPKRLPAGSTIADRLVPSSADFDAYIPKLNSPPTPYSEPTNLYPMASSFVSPTPAPSPDLLPPFPTAIQSMALSCMNLPVLVRNQFVSSILQLSARNGQFRDSTEFLVVGTQDRYPLPSPGAVGANTIQANGPSVITRFGEDLAVSERPGGYRLPLVKYNARADIYSDASTPAPSVSPSVSPSGSVSPSPNASDDDDDDDDDDHDNDDDNKLRHSNDKPDDQSQASPSLAFDNNQLVLPPPYGSPTPSVPDSLLPYEGEINPVMPNSPSPLQSSWGAYHSLIAGQLRNCYYLYKSKISRADNTDNLISAANSLEDRIETYIFRPNALNLDNFLFAPNSENQNAWEVASTLGTIQKCPYQGYVFPNGVPCIKPEPPDDQYKATSDLRPDLLGLMTYLSRGLIKIPSPPNRFVPNHSDADLATENNPSNYFKNDSWKIGASTEWPGSKAPVLIFTHQRISQFEADAIRNIITGTVPDLDPATNAALALHWSGRRIILVYMPVRSAVQVNPPTGLISNDIGPDADALRQGLAFEIGRLSYAFNVSTDSDVGNRLYVFSPDLEGNISSYRVNASEDEAFRSYWEDLLDSDSPEAIEQKAINIFLSSFFSTEKRL